MTDSTGRKKRKAGDLGPLPWLIAAVVTVAVAGGSWWMISSGEERAAQQVVAAREIRSSFEGLLGREGEANIEVKAESNGSAGEIERACKELLAQIDKDARAMDAAMKAMAFNELLKAERLAEPDGVGRARAAVVQARAMVAKHRKLRRQRLAHYREQVARVSIPASEKASLLSNFESALEISPMSNDRVWQMRDRILVLVDANLALLESSRGRWSLRRGGLAFQSEADRQAYNRNVYKANMAEWELSRLIARSTETARDRLTGDPD